MECIFRRRGAAAAGQLTLTLTGDFDSTRGYVTVGGTKYYTAQTLEIDAGTEVAVTVGALAGTPKVTYNGAEVMSGPGTYTFNISASTTVAMSTTNKYFYNAAITT